MFTTAFAETPNNYRIIRLMASRTSAIIEPDNLGVNCGKRHSIREPILKLMGSTN